MNISRPTLTTIPFTFLGLLATSLLATQASAQPPEGGPGPGGPLRAIMQALDANQDRELSASEIENATAALKSIDQNGDGVINKEDGPGRPEGGRGKGQADRAGKGPGKGAKGERQKGAGKAGKGRGQGKKAEGGDSDRDRAGRRGGAGGGQLVQRAMEFDTDGDGKLSQDELTSFVENMPGRQGGPGGRRGGQGQRGGKGGPR